MGWDVLNPFGGNFLGLGTEPNVRQSTVYTPGQQQTLDALTGSMQNYIPSMLGGLNNMANIGSSYEALPDFEQQYQSMFGNPLMQQYQTNIANLQGGPERHSSARLSRENSAMQQFNQSAMSARMQMLEQERTRRMQAEEQRRATQMGAYGQMAGLLGTSLNSRSFENTVTPGSNWLQPITQLLGAGQMVGNMMGGFGSSGMSGGMAGI